MAKRVGRLGTRLLALEPRVLFDGAVVETATAMIREAAGTGEPTPDAVAAKADPGTDAVRAITLPGAADSGSVREIVFIDSTLWGAEQLAQAARTGVEIVMLDPSQDGVIQISRALAGRSGIRAIHIVSHGEPGTLWLGASELSSENLGDYAAQLQSSRMSLAAGADILIYGCRAGAGDSGAQLAVGLSRLTGADVGASSDMTGGGAASNWSMELTWGDVQTPVYGDLAKLSAYESRLAAIDLAGNTGWSPLLYGSRQDPGGDQQASAASTDLVGDATHATLYFAYDDRGTADESDDEMAFRFRVSGANSQGGFGAIGMLGLDANLDGDLDIFIATDDRQGTAQISLFNPGTGLNMSPSTTSITPAPGRTYLGTAATYQFLAVDPVTDQDWNTTLGAVAANNDIDAGGKNDYFVSFKISFAEIKSELARINVAGNPAGGIVIDRYTPMRYVLATLTQNNSLNGDIGGIVGGNSSSQTFDQLGAFSPIVSASNSPPIVSSGGAGQTASYSVAAGFKQVTTITATDPDRDTLRYSISGADASKFTINATTGLLEFVSVPNAIVPTDADGDGRYQVTVQVRDYTDSSATVWKQGSDTQDLTITVTPQPDTTRPTLDLRTGITPTDNAAGIAPNANLFMTFSEAVQAGAGLLSIRNAAGTAATWRRPRMRKGSGCCARRSARSTCRGSACRRRAWCRAGAWSLPPGRGAPFRRPAGRCSRCLCARAVSRLT